MSKPSYAVVHPGVTHGEGVPDHLAIHELIADIPLDQLTGWFEGHLKEPIAECSVPTRPNVVNKAWNDTGGNTHIPAVPQEDDERDQTQCCVGRFDAGHPVPKFPPSVR